MSIIFNTDKCCFIDHKQFLDKIYTSCKISKDDSSKIVGTAGCIDKLHLEFDQQCFDIYLPFLMDSQIKKIIETTMEAKSASNQQHDPQLLKKRKRKLENVADSYHIQIKDFMHSALLELKEIGSQMALFKEPSLELMASNNRVARNVSKKVQERARKLAKLFSTDSKKHKKIATTSFSDPTRLTDINNTLVSYTGENPCITSFKDNIFVLPAKCIFCLANIDYLDQLLTLEKSYDFIVMDPPWFNKSVKRKKGYSTLSQKEILKIPIDRLSNDDCIVAVWVTNNQQLLTFVQEVLFPSWKVKFSAIWHWIKVTKSGKLICDLDSHHKKPYEHIVIGQKCKEDKPLNLHNHKIIFSIPSSIHSHKPPLHDVIRPFLKENSENLELFARYLLPGWTSWGNEVLLLQDVDSYKIL